jgi:predicted transcriptional regulator
MTMLRDYAGVMQPMPVPRGRRMFWLDEGVAYPVAMYQQTKTTFAVVYGLSVIENLSYPAAAAELSRAIAHAAECYNSGG